MERHTQEVQQLEQNNQLILVNILIKEEIQKETQYHIQIQQQLLVLIGEELALLEKLNN